MASFNRRHEMLTVIGSLAWLLFVIGNASAFVQNQNEAMSSITTMSTVAFKHHESISSLLKSPIRRHMAVVAEEEAEENDNDDDIALLDEIRSMRVKELKQKLMELQISTNDVFEKDELVERLYQAKINAVPNANNNNAPTAAPATTASSSAESSAAIKGDVIHAPLFFTGLDDGLRIAAVNIDGGITVQPGDQPYVTIQIEVVQDGSSSSFPLSLLLDTACSGFVLRPSVVQKYNLRELDTPITMTGAGGTSGGTGLTQIDKFVFGDETFGPLPAAVQDIGALPSTLDGIIGLSFLNQFPCVEMDFEKGDIKLYKTSSSVPSIIDDDDDADGSSKQTKQVVARGEMTMLPLGIYSVNVQLGTRGPVNMLVDTGAANTFLNWNGIDSLNIPRDDSSFLQRLSGWGAMGSDNVSMQLTHRINVSSQLNLYSTSSTTNSAALLPGVSLKDSKRLSIDIGDIAILDQLQAQNVGGILGIDVFMRCSGVRMTFQGPKKELLLLD